MADGREMGELFESVEDVYERSAALARDFTVMLEEKGFSSRMKNEGYIGTYVGPRKLRKPSAWFMSGFSIPFGCAEEFEEEPVFRLLAMTVVFRDNNDHKQQPYIKLGVAERDGENGWGQFTTSHGDKFYHPMGMGSYHGDFEFRVHSESELLAQATSVGDTSVGRMTYFAIPLVNVDSPDQLMKCCVDPLLALEGDLQNGVDVDGFVRAVSECSDAMQPAAKLPEMNA